MHVVWHLSRSDDWQDSQPFRPMSHQWDLRLARRILQRIVVCKPPGFEQNVSSRTHQTVSMPIALWPYPHLRRIPQLHRPCHSIHSVASTPSQEHSSKLLSHCSCILGMQRKLRPPILHFRWIPKPEEELGICLRWKEEGGKYLL